MKSEPSVTNYLQTGYLVNHQIRLVRAGHEYFDLLEGMINGARQSIHLQTYIFDDDETGQRVAKALMRAAARKVKVFIVVDGYASQDLSGKFIKQLRDAGVYFRFFDPLLKSRYFYFGRRLHHKVVVVDARYSLVGGINIGNHYNNTAYNVAWLDWALFVEGPLGFELQQICEKRIKNVFVNVLNRVIKPPLAIDALGESYFLVRPRINDWVRRKREITNTYLEMFDRADSRITIISSYFIPGFELRKHISEAAKRGVSIRVILAGISDVDIAKHAERYMYHWLLENNIRIFEYQRKVLHAKLATYDGKFVTIGSFNVNNISAYASIELNLDVWNEPFASDVEARLQRIIDTDCKEITSAIYLKGQSLWVRFIQRSAYDIFRFLLFIFTFYFKQRD